MKKNKSIDILLPCYNEEKTIREQIERIKKIIKSKKYSYNIVVCDNNSNDNSRKIARDEKVKVLIEKEQGYGATLLNGINKSKAEYIVMLDCDLSYNEKHIPNLIAQLESGYDLVIGNRFNGNVEKGAMPISHRYGSKMLTEYANLLFRTPSHDYHCGLRAFKREEILKCNLSSTGFEFASEMIIKAKLNGLIMKEIKTDLFVDGRNKPSHLNIIKDGFRHLQLINKTKFNNSLLFRYFTTFSIVVFILLLLSFFSTMIPHKLIEKNTLKSVEELNSTFNENIFNKKEYNQYEQYGDIRNYAMIYQEDEKKPMDSLIEKNYLEDCDILTECPETLKNNTGKTVDYSRYWHGQSSILKVLTIFFSIKTINVISLILLLVLFLYTSYSLWIKDKLFSIAFFLSGLAVNIFFVSKSFQFFPVFIIMLIGINIVIRNYDKKIIDILFLVLGMITCFFDFLTVETVTLTMPLLTYIYLKINKNESIPAKDIIRYILLWGIGYSLLFVLKWIIVICHYGFPYINNLYNDLYERIKLSSVNDSNIAYVVIKNFIPILPFALLKNGLIFEIVIIIIFIIYELLISKKYSLLLVPCTIPIIRYLLISSHSYTLYYFTYRALYPVIVFAIISLYDIINNIVGSDKNEQKDG